MHVTGIEERAKLIGSGEPAECSASAVLLHTLYFAVCEQCIFLQSFDCTRSKKPKSYIYSGSCLFYWVFLGGLLLDWGFLFAFVCLFVF